MAFTVPQFNLTCVVAGMALGTWATRVIRLASLDCNLAMGKRIQATWNDQPEVYLGASSPSLLCPVGSDVQDWSGGGEADMIECPAGSGRWYQVDQVDDVGKGFANEYRFVWMHKAFQQINPTRYAGLQWPVPIP